MKCCYNLMATCCFFPWPPTIAQTQHFTVLELIPHLLGPRLAMAMRRRRRHHGQCNSTRFDAQIEFHRTRESLLCYHSSLSLFKTRNNDNWPPRNTILIKAMALTTGIGGREAILDDEARVAMSAAEFGAAVTGPDPPVASGFWNVYTVRAGR